MPDPRLQFTPDDIAAAWADPEFIALPEEQRISLMGQMDSTFGSLPMIDRRRITARMAQTFAPKPPSPLINPLPEAALALAQAGLPPPRPAGAPPVPSAMQEVGVMDALTRSGSPPPRGPMFNSPGPNAQIPRAPSGITPPIPTPGTSAVPQAPIAAPPVPPAPPAFAPPVALSPSVGYPPPMTPLSRAMQPPVDRSKQVDPVEAQLKQEQDLLKLEQMRANAATAQAKAEQAQSSALMSTWLQEQRAAQEAARTEQQFQKIDAANQKAEAAFERYQAEQRQSKLKEDEARQKSIRERTVPGMEKLGGVAPEGSPQPIPQALQRYKPLPTPELEYDPFTGGTRPVMGTPMDQRIDQMQNDPMAVGVGSAVRGFSGATLGAAGGLTAMAADATNSPTLRNVSEGLNLGDRLVQDTAARPEDVASFDEDPVGAVSDPRWWADSIGNGVGSMIPMMVSGAAAGRIAQTAISRGWLTGRAAEAVTKYGPAAIAGLSEGLMAAGNTYNEAIDAGASPEVAREAAALVAAGTSATAIPAFKVGVFQDRIQSLGRKIATSVAAESGQEGVQTWWENLVASKLSKYDPNRPLSRGVAEGMVGGAFGGVASAVIEGPAKPQSQPETQVPTGAPENQRVRDLVTGNILTGEQAVSVGKYREAVLTVLEAGKASPAILQRKLRLDYGEASRAIEAMEREGIVGPAEGNAPRRILKRPDWTIGAEAPQGPEQTEQTYSAPTQPSTPVETPSTPVAAQPLAQRPAPAGLDIEEVPSDIDEILDQQDQQQRANNPRGNKATVQVARGYEVDTQYEMVPLSSLLISHDPKGMPNPLYPKEIQPRQRDRKASEIQIANIAQKLDAEQLGENVFASYGAPIVGVDDAVESGNGRSNGLLMAMQEQPELFQSYQRQISRQAKRFGMDPEQVQAFVAANPDAVLIRRRVGELPAGVDRPTWTKDANEDAQSSMSAGEQAFADSRRLTPDLVGQFVPNENGDIATTANMPFIRAFIEKVVPPGQRNTMQLPKGELSLSGIQRIRNAIFARAYNDRGIVERLTEDPDDNIKSIVGALTIAAPKFIAMQAGIESGDLHALDISEGITDAASKISYLRENGIKLADYLRNGNIFGEQPLMNAILGAFGSYGRNKAELADLFGRYTEAVNAIGNPKQAGMFGPAEIPSPEALFIRVLERKLDEDGRKPQEPQQPVQPGNPPGGTGQSGSSLRLPVEPEATAGPAPAAQPGSAAVAKPAGGNSQPAPVRPPSPAIADPSDSRLGPEAPADSAAAGQPNLPSPQQVDAEPYEGAQAAYASVRERVDVNGLGFQDTPDLNKFIRSKTGKQVGTNLDQKQAYDLVEAAINSFIGTRPQYAAKKANVIDKIDQLRRLVARIMPTQTTRTTSA